MRTDQINFNAQKWLIKPEYYLLECLFCIVFFIAKYVTFFAIFLPKIVSPYENIRNSYCRRLYLYFLIKPDYILPQLQLWCYSFEPRINSGPTPFHRDSRYRLRSKSCLFLYDRNGYLTSSLLNFLDDPLFIIIIEFTPT